MQNELDILKDISQRFNKAGIQFMLTGSLALSYYTQPRMTRDIDLVVDMPESASKQLASIFGNDYYFSQEAILDAIETPFVFNVIHLQSAIKVDCIIRKKDNYRKLEFSRRKEIEINDFLIPIVSKEDLIISKLIWFRESGSELQKLDVYNLLQTKFDEQYLEHWVTQLNLKNIFEEIKNA